MTTTTTPINVNALEAAIAGEAGFNGGAPVAVIVAEIERVRATFGTAAGTFGFLEALCHHYSTRAVRRILARYRVAAGLGPRS